MHSDTIKSTRHKKVLVHWAAYDKSRLSDCKRVVDTRKLFKQLNVRIQRREFELSSLATFLLLKTFLNTSYRGLAGLSKTFGIWAMLDLKRNPCYKTIQRTMGYISVDLLGTINRMLLPKDVRVAAADSSGLKTTRRCAWIIIRFKRRNQRKDFKKYHILVDVRTKKILVCTLARGYSSDRRYLSRMLRKCAWCKFEIILGDAGYDSRDCFNAVDEMGAKAGIKVRKNATTKARRCPSRRRAVIAQKEDYEKWKKDIEYSMRCVVESVFSATKRRFGEVVHSVKTMHRRKETWLRTIVWNLCIYETGEE